MLGLHPFGAYGLPICFGITDRDNGYTCGKRHFGVVAFAGGVPVYDCNGKLIGGAGASGDSVDSDDLVTRKAINLAKRDTGVMAGVSPAIQTQARRT